MPDPAPRPAPPTDPALLEALVLRLPNGGTPPLHLLGPVTALRELEVTARSVVAGHGEVNEHDAGSVRRDVQKALAGLGPATARRLAVDLTELGRDVGQLPARLRAPRTAQRMVAAAQALLIRLDADDVAAAAWQDTVDAFADPGVTFDACELRLQALRELTELRGHDWDWLAEDLVACLEGDAERLRRAAADGGDASDRLAACRWHAARAMPETELVVWVGFSNAHMHVERLAAGPVAFFALSGWPESARADAPELDRLGGVPDASALFAELRPVPGDPGDGRVLARVDLGRAKLVQALELARELASDALLVVHQRSAWRPLLGAAACVPAEDDGEDRWFGVPLREDMEAHSQSFFGALEDRFETSVRFSRTARDLRMLDGVRAREPHALEAIDFLRWSAAVAKVPHDGQRLGLSVRLIERALPRGEDEHWSAAIAHYLKDRWAEAALVDHIAWAGRVATSRLAMLGDAGWRRRLFPALEGRMIGADLLQVAAHLHALREALPPDDHGQRLLGEMAEAWSSGPQAERWLRRQGEGFDILLDRAVRHRNAVLHGADTVEPAVRSARRFLSPLQGMLVSERLASAAEGMSLLTRLERGRVRAIERRERLAAGDPPGEVLFQELRPLTIKLPAARRRPFDELGSALVSATGELVDLAAPASPDA